MAFAQQNILQPGDPIIGSSANSPASEGPSSAIDWSPWTKYLNFDTSLFAGLRPSGFIVTPSVGLTRVTGILLQSANDLPERDPKVITIEGSNDSAVTAWDAGNWEQITRIDNVPPFSARFQTKEIQFENTKSFRHYRFTVLQTRTPNNCCFQIATVGLLGSLAPQDVTQPEDRIVAIPSNGPEAVGIANVTDDRATKYLSPDVRGEGRPPGFMVTPGIGATAVMGLTIRSADDTPELDPRVVLLEGSNDRYLDDTSGHWEQIARLDNIPPFADRLQVQEFLFPNTKTFKHYRFSVLETQSTNGCCFQVSEIELLAMSQGLECAKARFLTQPENTLVLNGAPATFVAVVNGPWPLQWYRNGEPIPGATSAAYTTGPVSPANASDVYTVQIKGCQVSSPARAVIHAPSATKSIGISFRGGGAHGTPTINGPTAVTGILPQAYWNDAQSDGSGTLPDLGANPAHALLSSDGTPSTITFDFQTSGTWGAGTGESTPTARILNGLVHQQPNSTSPGLTFRNVPAGRHSVLVYTVGIPQQFQDADYTITGAKTETYHVRVMNADQYRTAPGFHRGISRNPAARSLASYVRFDNVEADAAGNINLNWVTVTLGFDRGAPVNAIQLILNSVAAPEPPAITVQPLPTVVPLWGDARIGVTALGEGLTYQWRKNGRNLPEGPNITGTRTAHLTISAFRDVDEGVYSVAVFNAGGSVVSANVFVRASRNNLNDDLVGYWNFDESSGNMAANSAVGGRPATVNGSANWAVGKIGNAFGFDGGTYLLVDSFIPATREIAASAWVYIPEGTRVTMPIFRNARGVLAVDPGTPAGQFEFGIVADAHTGEVRLQAAMNMGPNLVRASAPARFFGDWHHVAFSMDGAQLRLYVDGAQVAATDYIGSSNTLEIPFISFGAQLNVIEGGILGPDRATPNFYVGQVDDVGLWTRSLSAEEVKEIHAAGVASRALTTVALTHPEVEPGALSVSYSCNIMTLRWNRGILQSSPSLNGPWVDVPSHGILTRPAPLGTQFFRTALR